MSLDAVLLSRLQFAFTIGYHILWPAYTIGISSFIIVLNVLWLATPKQICREQSRWPLAGSESASGPLRFRKVSRFGKPRRRPKR